MKKIKLEGIEFEEIKKQITTINAIKAEIISLSESAALLQSKMWENIDKIFPDRSENCSISLENGDIIFIDRLKD